MNVKHILPIALTIALVSPPSGLAEASSIPVAVPPVEVAPGYDWSSRVHSTKLTIDATPLASVLDATNVTAPNIDLVITGLMPWRTYRFTAGVWDQLVHSDSFGHAVAWNLPAETATWMLLDGISGEPVTSISIVGPHGMAEVIAPVPQSDECRCYMTGCHGCSDGYEIVYRPPQPEFSAPLEGGYVIVQGAYSFTPDVTIETSECYEHAVTVEAKATAGLASNGGTAGGSFTFIEKICIKLMSRGSPKELLLRNNFKKDTYEDDSYKVYSIGRASEFKVADPDLVWEPWEGTETIEFDPSSYPQPLTITRFERSNTGVLYGFGVGVYGIGLGVTIRGTDAWEDAIEMTFQPPAEGARYRYTFISENENSGLIGVAWREQ